jgi:tetratricopeptide (TPR) repeat protein
MTGTDHPPGSEREIVSDVVMAAALIVVAASPEDYDIWARPIVAAGQVVVSLVAGSPADQGQLIRLLTDLAGEWTDPRARQDLRDLIAALLSADGELTGQVGTVLSSLRSWLTDDQDAQSMMNLAGLLAQHDDLRGAMAAYRQVIGWGSGEAAVRLVRLLAPVCESEAIATAQELTGSGHPDVRPAAYVALGEVLGHLGDWAGATQACQQAIQTGRPPWAQQAMMYLASLAPEGRDGVAGAEELYRQVIATGHPDFVAHASNLLALSRRQEGDAGTALAIYRQLIETSGSHEADSAMIDLANVLGDQGDADALRDAHQLAVRAGNCCAPLALSMLGHVLREAGDVAGARGAYQQAIDEGDVSSAWSLAGLLEETVTCPAPRPPSST